ncbi:MAG: relaxase/mobilization nuclease domain-containing protein [Oscillospiraceae bacterium]|nr:relaxase/mobilization nuclease domain-containing protein [Oscillospiraceae bacterium]
MAYDKIIVVRARLDNRIRYALNETKTLHLENGQVLQTAINCQLNTAYREMQETKRRWDKETRPVQGYHIIHSFSPGEVTPEQAHWLSVEFAERLLQGRFEAVVAIHIDHGHIHAHIVFNSVSCTDGKMFRDDFKAYYGDIRGISNEISWENDLSVIEPIGSGKPYAEWNAEKNGKPTVRGLIRQDVDAALAEAFTLQSFYDALQKREYAIKRGANVKHTAVKPPGSDRFVRLDSLGDGYTEANIRERLNKSRTQPTAPEPQAATSLYIPKGRYKVKCRSPAYGKKQKLSGMRRLYLHYLYLLSPPRSRRLPVPFPVRAEVRKLDQYKRQFSLLQKYSINSESQLSMLADALQSDIDSLVFSRRELYRRQRRGEDVSAEIKEISLALRPIRRELKCCQHVADRIPQIQEHIRLTRQTEEQNMSEKTKPKEETVNG